MRNMRLGHQHGDGLMALRRFEFARLTGRIRDELVREKRKTIVLLVLAASAMCTLMVRMVWSTSTPSRALGGIGPSTRAGVQGPASAVGAYDPLVMAGMDQFGPRTKESYFTRVRREITRDLFAANPEVFPPQENRSLVKVVSGGEGPSGEEAERAQRKRIIQAQARALVLQSTVISDNPIGIINGRVLRVGDWINGFRMVTITPRSCTLEKRGMKVILEMNSEENQQIRSSR